MLSINYLLIKTKKNLNFIVIIQTILKIILQNGIEIILTLGKIFTN